MLCKLNPWLIFPLYTFENFTLNIHLFGTQNAEILVPHCWLKTIWNDYNSCKNKTPKLFEVSKVLAKKKSPITVSLLAKPCHHIMYQGQLLLVLFKGCTRNWIDNNSTDSIAYRGLFLVLLVYWSRKVNV